MKITCAFRFIFLTLFVLNGSANQTSDTRLCIALCLCLQHDDRNGIEKLFSHLWCESFRDVVSCDGLSGRRAAPESCRRVFYTHAIQSWNILL